MARIYVLLVLATVLVSDATTAKTTATTTPKAGSGKATTKPPPWYKDPKVKNGLIGGAAAAGLATFAGLGISAIVQANKATTPPPLITTPWVAPTLPVTTPQFTFVLTTPQLQARADQEGSSISPLLLGLLSLLALCCCLGAVGFCIFMKTRKRATKPKSRQLPVHEEEQPLVHHPPPPQPSPQSSGHYEQPMMLAPVTTTTGSYVPATTVSPSASMYAPATTYATGSMYAPSSVAPATTYATGSMYAPSSVYAPATAQYAGIGGPQIV